MAENLSSIDLVMRTISGQQTIRGDVDLLDTDITNAKLVITGNVLVRGNCFVDNSSMVAAEGDIEIFEGVHWSGTIRCRRFATHGPFISTGVIEAIQAHFAENVELNAVSIRDIEAKGHLDAQRIVAKTLTVHGDLIAEYVEAEKVSSSRQVLVHSLSCPNVHAPIIGNFTSQRLPASCYFSWSRPMPFGWRFQFGGSVTRDMALSRRSGRAALMEFAGHISGTAELKERLVRTTECADFHAVMNDIIAHLVTNRDKVCPAVQEMLECFERRGFPDDLWRL